MSEKTLGQKLKEYEAYLRSAICRNPPSDDDEYNEMRVEFVASHARKEALREELKLLKNVRWYLDGYKPISCSFAAWDGRHVYSDVDSKISAITSELSKP